MYFNSAEFLLFFGIVFIFSRFRPIAAYVLLVASLIFYIFADWLDFVLFLVVASANWAFAYRVANSRLWLGSAIAINVAVLAFFKYRSLMLFGTDTPAFSFAGIAIPLGISFYIFQKIAYLIDIYRGEAVVIRSLPRFGLFAAFFPQLIAGPIVRAWELLPQVNRIFRGKIKRPRLLSFGLGMILLGLFKKIVLADSLAPYVEDIFIAPNDDALRAWVGVWLFAFQLYFDFSGYCDIAIGAARLLGVRLPINFRTPYLSRDPREFWQRWHITLSTWIRDYLYIPLGGSRSGNQIVRITVLVFVMSVAGLWHGANLTFVVWGALWGTYIAVARLSPVPLSNFGVAAWPLHMGIVLVLWVFFRSPDMAVAVNYVGIMFAQGAVGAVTSIGLMAVIGCALLMVLHVLENHLLAPSSLALLRRFDGPLVWGLSVGLSFWLVLLPRYSANPFIYFRF